MRARVVLVVALVAVTVIAWSAGAGANSVSLAVTKTPTAKAKTKTPTRAPTAEQATAEATVEATAPAAGTAPAEGTAPAGEATPAEGTPGAAGRPLDLAAMILLPSDVTTAGYGISDSQMRTIEQDAGLLNSLQGGSRVDGQKVLKELKDAGWQQSYFGKVSVATTDDPNTFATSISTSLIAFADAAGAAKGWTMLHDAEDAAGYRPATGGGKIGDQSALTRTAGTSANGKTHFEELDYTFQVGNIVAEVSIDDFTNHKPEVATIAALAGKLQKRIETTRDKGGPGLSVQSVRLGGDAVTAGFDYYERRGNTMFPDYNETRATLRSDDNYYKSVGITDIYFVKQRVPAGGPGPDDDVTFYLTLDRFSDEAAATQWAKERPQQFVDSPGSSYDVKIVSDAPTFGDQSTTISYGFDRDKTKVRGFTVYLRVKETVALVELDGVPDVPQAAIEEVAGKEVDCLSSGACLERVAIPADLATGPTAGTPEATAGATTEATAAPTARSTRRTPTPTPKGTGGASLRVKLVEQNGSGVSGLATLAAAGTKASVKIALTGASEGQVAVIQKGTCDNLDPDPAFVLHDVDADGHSDTTVNTSLDKLKSGGFAIAVHASVDDLTKPLACGVIPAR